MDSIRLDVAQAFRKLQKAPGMTLVIVLSLAIGIGMNSAIFSTINALLLRPLPYPDPGRIVQVLETYEGRGSGWSLSFPDFDDYRKESRAFTAVAAATFRGFNFGGSDAQRIDGVRATSGIFRVLGISPALGRPFTAAEDTQGGEAVAVISNAFWRDHFASKQSVLGSTMILDGAPRRIIGVMPAGFTFFGQDIAVIVPLAVDESTWKRTNGGLTGYARVRPGLDWKQGQADLSRVATLLNLRYPEMRRGRGVELTPLAEVIYDGDFRKAVYLLFASVGAVLLIACMNIANLLLAAAVGREKEIAVRVALGARKGRIVRMLLTESLLLSLSGGIVGLGVSVVAISALKRWGPEGLAGIEGIGIDARVIAFTFAVSVATGLLFGLAPAAFGARSTASGLRDATRGGTSGRGIALRRGLIAGEIALAVVLLVSAGLMIRTIGRLLGTNAGFESKNLVVAQASLGKNYDSVEKINAFHTRLLSEIRSIPGVIAAGGVDTLPLAGTNNYTNFELEEHPVSNISDMLNTGSDHVTTGYFEAMGIHLIQGRLFDERDAPGSQPVAIVNRAAASKYWPGRSALGHRVRMGQEKDDDGNPVWRTVVGVVADVRHRGIDEPPREEIYRPYAQLPFQIPSITFVVRTASEPESVTGALRAAIRKVDPGVPLYGITTMNGKMRESMLLRRAMTVLLSLFAFTALVLAGIGLYGVISYVVAQRRREIGIRSALGASPDEILKMIVGQAARLTTTGVGIGVVLALAAARAMSSLVYEVSTADPLTILTVVLVVGAIGVGAAWAPGRRAAAIEAVEALRAE